MPKRFLLLSSMAGVLAVLALPLSSCDTPVGQGAGIGAATGAVVGGLATNRVSGAAVGAGVGAVAGGLVGAAVQESDAPAYGARPRGGYPEAKPTSRRGFVISPYSPFYEIDVQGAPHGALARDPSCNRLFVNP